jgi:CCR4-NOT transcriptional complex subunit CAF120
MNITAERMRGYTPPTSSPNASQSAPQFGQLAPSATPTSPVNQAGPQSSEPASATSRPVQRQLTPITERSTIDSQYPANRRDGTQTSGSVPVLEEPMNASPTSTAPAPPEKGVYENTLINSNVSRPELSAVSRMDPNSSGERIMDLTQVMESPEHVDPATVALPISPPDVRTPGSPSAAGQPASQILSPTPQSRALAASTSAMQQPQRDESPGPKASSSQLNILPSQPSTSNRPVSESNFNISGEAAAALYFMQQMESEPEARPSGRSTRSTSYDDTTSPSEYSPVNGASTSKSPPRSGTPMAFVNGRVHSSDPETPTVTRDGLGRKPSGARDLPTNNSPIVEPLPRVAEESASQDRPAAFGSQMSSKNVSAQPVVDDATDALVAFSFLEQQESRRSLRPPSPPQIQTPTEPEAMATNDKPSRESSPGNQYRSSFAPSKIALERQLRSQAQQEAHHAAAHKPGRLNGRKKGKAKEGGTWNDSSEEEEEDEEDDDDADSDTQVPATGSRLGHSALGLPRQLPQPQGPLPAPPVPPAPEVAQVPHLRAPRTLPQIPGARASGTWSLIL